MSVPEQTIWWHVYPLGALGAPMGGQTGDGSARTLRDLIGWLDYAADLGCTGLLLGPIFASTAHGYDTLDHYAIDPRLGSDDDFDALLAAAHAKGFVVALDGVFNHVGAQHPLVTGGSDLAVRHDGRPTDWEGCGDLILLDHANPAVANLVVDVLDHWMRRGVDGWRFDVAYAVPGEFWRTVTARVRAEFPGAWFLGEVIHGDYPAIADAGTLDSVTAYELWKAIWSSIADENLWELAWGLERHAEFSAGRVLGTFVGNHDVTRIASRLGDTGAALAAALLLTLPGMPTIYYGDEQAFRGEKGDSFGADYPLRPPLPATPAGLAADGWWQYRLHQELIALRTANPWLVRGGVRVLGKDNGWLDYEVSGEGHRLIGRLRLGETSAIEVLVDDQPAFAWHA